MYLNVIHFVLCVCFCILGAGINHMTETYDILIDYLLKPHRGRLFHADMASVLFISLVLQEDNIVGVAEARHSLWTGARHRWWCRSTTLLVTQEHDIVSSAGADIVGDVGARHRW
jgi:hypothetical protein